MKKLFGCSLIQFAAILPVSHVSVKLVVTRLVGQQKLPTRTSKASMVSFYLIFPDVQYLRFIEELCVCQLHCATGSNPSIKMASVKIYILQNLQLLH